LIDHNAGADRVVVVAGEQSGQRRRAERRGMKALIAQAHLRDPVERRRRYYATESAGRSETNIVGHDEQDIRRTLRRHYTCQVGAALADNGRQSFVEASGDPGVPVVCCGSAGVDLVSCSYGCCLPGPAELGAVNPEAVHDDRQAAG
jgi:hypothetical protein